MGRKPTLTPQQEEAAQRVAGLLQQAQALAREHGVASTKKSQPHSTRQIVAAIRHARLYPDPASDDPAAPTVDINAASAHNYVAEALRGEVPRVADASWVLAVAAACHLIAGQDFEDDRRTELLAAVKSITEAAPAPPMTVDAPPATTPRPRRLLLAVAAAVVVAAAAVTAVTLAPDDAPAETNADSTRQPDSKDAVRDCLDGTHGEIIEQPAAVFTDSDATMILPTLDFDIMNGSARYLSHKGPKYYWGRAGSDDHDPHSGGVRLQWKTDGGPWHECRTPLPKEERDYVRTPAVPTVIDNRAVTIKICLWRDNPYMQKCTAELS
ncbi:hypothetical protein LG634_21420 [Streptomyces bambusae]|uniref:hypothetical protein n=1 Tax=Streptomyces bambusae TaxID=1550616 RepID=UPI001CFE44A5|nr:hypothetical protein [Streptomyces bambusae]MCB5167386.1 hypothetical protein [Streptomyces bambusae]